MSTTRRTLKEFAELYGLELRVERGLHGWSACLAGIEIKEGGILVSTRGSGSNPRAAVKDYGERIANKLLVHNAYSDDRREFFADKTFAPG